VRLQEERAINAVCWLWLQQNYGAVIWICVKAFSLSHFDLTTQASRLGVHKKLQVDTARTAASSWPNRYPTAYDTVLSNKSSGQGWGKGDVGGYRVCLLKWLLCLL